MPLTGFVKNQGKKVLFCHDFERVWNGIPWIQKEFDKKGVFMGADLKYDSFDEENIKKVRKL